MGRETESRESHDLAREALSGCPRVPGGSDAPEAEPAARWDRRGTRRCAHLGGQAFAFEEDLQPLPQGLLLLLQRQDLLVLLLNLGLQLGQAPDFLPQRGQAVVLDRARRPVPHSHGRSPCPATRRAAAPGPGRTDRGPGTRSPEPTMSTASPQRHRAVARSKPWPRAFPAARPAAWLLASPPTVTEDTSLPCGPHLPSNSPKCHPRPPASHSPNRQALSSSKWKTASEDFLFFSGKGKVNVSASADLDLEKY